ncbi:MAG: hypothetical protein ACAI25_10580, partial [Planctomycetota bacterium]
GDVLTTLNGKALKGWQQLQAGYGSDPDENAPPSELGVYRDGQTFTVSVKGGKSIWELGLMGDFAKGSAR